MGKILVTDDDKIGRKMAQMMLTKLGYEPEMAESGEQCIELLKANAASYDLLLLDVEMPGMNGIETLKKIRSESDIADIKVMLLSGTDDMDEYLSDGELKLLGYVQKPFVPANMKQAIDKALS
ncbi:MAG: response regulator [Lachnospiraceae bacterium]|nr:response regulator [Lachnospiraceae bacterium]